MTTSPAKREPSNDNDSEIDDDEMTEAAGERHHHRGRNGGSSNDHKFKCALCDFETVSHDIYRNHLMLHATKDQDSPPPLLPTSIPTLPTLPQLPQYPLQIKSPLSINSEAKAMATAALLGKAAAKKEATSNNNDTDIPSSSSAAAAMMEDSKNSNGGSSKPSEYLEFMKKFAPAFFKHSAALAPSPSGISSTQTGSPPTIHPPFTQGSTSDLISKLYFGNVFKNMTTSATTPTPTSPLPSLSPLRKDPSTSEKRDADAVKKNSPEQNPDQPEQLKVEDEENNPTQTSRSPPAAADSSSGALDLTRAQPPFSPAPSSRPQSGSQTSTSNGSSSSKSRRKGKAFKIERKALNAADRDSLNSGHSGYSNDMVDVDAKSDGSASSGSGSGSNPNSAEGGGVGGKETTSSNGNLRSILPLDVTSGEAGGGVGGEAKALSGSHVCKFCEIAFMDSVMFTIHMGYHGFSNPFKCNMCGDEFEDRVGFFLHMARKAHQ